MCSFTQGKSMVCYIIDVHSFQVKLIRSKDRHNTLFKRLFRFYIVELEFFRYGKLITLSV